MTVEFLEHQKGFTKLIFRAISNRITSNLRISPGEVTLMDMEAKTLLRELRQQILIDLE
jgi:hypothetical protein